MSRETLITDAIVLSASAYQESSVLLSLFTRKAGVLSAMAHGGRSSRKRFGTALGIFAEGEAVIEVKTTRGIQTLISFAIRDSHAGLASDLDRFMAGSAVLEVVRVLFHEDAAAQAYERLSQLLTAVSSTSGDSTTGAALAGLWQLVSDAGFQPAIDHCAECLSELDPAEKLPFRTASGGMLCSSCARFHVDGRPIPATDRATIRSWLKGEPVPVGGAHARAHLSLLMGFLGHYLPAAQNYQALKYWQSTLQTV